MSKQEVLQQKYRPTTSKTQQYISLYTWGTFYPCVHQNHLECLLLKKHFLVSSDHRSQSIWSSSRVWQLNMLEIVFGWARIIFLETLPNNTWWCRCCLTIYLKGFLTPRRNYFLQFSSCGPWRVFSHSNTPGLPYHPSSATNWSPPCHAEPSIEYIYSKWTYFPEGQQFTKIIFFYWFYERILICWDSELVGFC